MWLITKAKQRESQALAWTNFTIRVSIRQIFDYEKCDDLDLSEISDRLDGKLVLDWLEFEQIIAFNGLDASSMVAIAREGAELVSKLEVSDDMMRYGLELVCSFNKSELVLRKL